MTVREWLVHKSRQHYDKAFIEYGQAFNDDSEASADLRGKRCTRHRDTAEVLLDLFIYLPTAALDAEMKEPADAE